MTKWILIGGEFVDSDWLEGNGKTSRDVNEMYDRSEVDIREISIKEL